MPAASEASPQPDSDEHQALEQLVAEHGAALFRVAFAITQSAALAEEVVQDSLVKAIGSMTSWEDDVPIRWMRRVTRNRAISVMRHERRAEPTDEWDDRLSGSSGVERTVEGRLTLAAVRAALADLDEQSRLLIVLREADMLSYDDIADLVDLTPSAVKAKLYRARHSLRAVLESWELG